MSDAGGSSRGLLVGRFQPFHRGHLGVVEAIRRARPTAELIVAIGSAQESYTPENPFTAGERFEMIRAALIAAKVEGCLVVPLPDVQRHGVWVAHAEEILPRFGVVHSNNPLTRRLFERGGYRVEPTAWVDRDRFEGRKVRAAMAADRNWSELVPPAVAELLRELHAVHRLAELLGPGSADGAAR